MVVVRVPPKVTMEIRRKEHDRGGYWLVTDRHEVELSIGTTRGNDGFKSGP